MMLQRHHLITLVALGVLVVLVFAGVLVSSQNSSRHNRGGPVGSPAKAAAVSPNAASQWTPVPPLTDLPAQTPVQAQYDAALASGLASSSSVRAAEAARVPSPGFSSGWNALPVANTPEQWVAEFTKALLTIHFAYQTRTGLGQWLSAEEAPELLAGVPASIADKVLYLSLFETAATGGTASPVPDPVTWAADARAGVRWSVSNLVVQADPQFSQIVASGWEPVDQRFAVEDVTGLLPVAHGSTRTRTNFSMTVYVGSAHWHDGYGTVLVNDWKEN
jgi:hypothetical protein